MSAQRPLLASSAMRTRAEIVTQTMRPFERGVWTDGEAFRSYTTEQRRRYAKSGIALPDGSFPIPDCGAAKDAISSQGRGQTPDSQRRVVAHIRKRVRALGCSGGIFDDYR